MMRLRLLKRTLRSLRKFGATLVMGSIIAFSSAEHGVRSEIAYYSNKEGEWDWIIHIMDADGSNPVQLALGGMPSWSPDGTKIAFSHGSNGFHGDVADIYLIDGDGENRVNLTQGQHQRNLFPAWSPDGTKIAFWSDREDQPDIYLMEADGTNPINLTRDPHNEDRPSWSPDGAKIAFGALQVPRGEQNMSDIFVMDADGANRINLTQNPESVNQFPAWSPDGKRIAYEASSNPNRWFAPYNIYVMNADGSRPVMLTEERRFASEGLPTWSPSGAKIAFHRREPDGRDDIFVINVDGTGLLNITATLLIEEINPSWSPVPSLESRRERLVTKWGAVKFPR